VCVGGEANLEINLVKRTLLIQKEKQHVFGLQGKIHSLLTRENDTETNKENIFVKLYH
jgi:hypothetical protein